MLEEDPDRRWFLWYYWEPRQRESGCPEILHQSRAVNTVRLQVRATRPPGGSTVEWRRALVDQEGRGAPLRITAIFGYINHQHPRPTAAAVRECLRASQGCADLEWGATQYTSFLRALRSELTAPTETQEEIAGALVVAVRGQLRRSGRAIELRAELLETDLLAPAPFVAQHTPRLLAALDTADVLLYAGHSGLGLNLSVAQLERAAAPAQVDAVLRRSPTRLVGFLGCYTYSYFGQDLAQRLRGGVGRDVLFVYTGNAVSALADSALHVLATLDCALAQPLKSDAGACAAARPTEDFLIYDYAR